MGWRDVESDNFSASAFHRVKSNCTVRCSRDLQIGKLGHRGQNPACRCSTREGHPRSTEGHLEGLQFSVPPVAPAEVAENYESPPHRPLGPCGAPLRG